ncbi:MAG TPA: hypothetical protein VHX40_05585, partial [Acidimicrobiales bacterium]|nr:hypothetical protein [Acidimicrobiales bacterium]
GGAVALFFNAAPRVSGDSNGYRDPTGRSATFVIDAFKSDTARPWTVIAPFTLFGSDQWIVLCQTVLYVLAWSLLVYAVGRSHLLNRWGTLAVGFVLVTMALSPQLWVWNHQILSESLSVSYGVAAAAFLLLFIGRWRRPLALVGFSASATLLIITKPPEAVLLGPLALVLGGIEVHRARSRTGPDRQRRWTIVAMITVVALLAAGALSTWTNERFWEQHLSRQATSLMYLASTSDPINPSIRASLRQSSMPRCFPMSKALPVTRDLAIEAHLATTCPRFNRWAVASFGSWYAGYAVTHLDQIRAYLEVMLPPALVPQFTAADYTATLTPMTEAIWGSAQPAAVANPLAPVQIPPTAYGDLVPVALLVGNVVLIADAIRRRRRRASARTWWLVAFGFIDLALVVVVWQDLIFPSTVVEMGRNAIVENTLVRGCAIVLFVMLLERIWPRFRSDASGSGTTSGPPERAGAGSNGA